MGGLVNYPCTPPPAQQIDSSGTRVSYVLQLHTGLRLAGFLELYKQSLLQLSALQGGQQKWGGKVANLQKLLKLL